MTEKSRQMTAKIFSENYSNLDDKSSLLVWFKTVLNRVITMRENAMAAKQKFVRFFDVIARRRDLFFTSRTARSLDLLQNYTREGKIKGKPTRLAYSDKIFHSSILQKLQYN